MAPAGGERRGFGVGGRGAVGGGGGGGGGLETGRIGLGWVGETEGDWVIFEECPWDSEKLQIGALVSSEDGVWESELDILTSLRGVFLKHDWHVEEPLLTSLIHRKRLLLWVSLEGCMNLLPHV